MCSSSAGMSARCRCRKARAFRTCAFCPWTIRDMASASALGALLLKSPLFRDSSLTLHGQYTRPLTFLEFVSGIALRLLGLAGLEADEQEEGKKGGGGGGGRRSKSLTAGMVRLSSSIRRAEALFCLCMPLECCTGPCPSCLASRTRCASSSSSEDTVLC
jgi:hypothetical protein